MRRGRFSNWYVLLLVAVLLPIHPLVLQRGILLQHDLFASDLLHSAFPYRAFLGKHLSQGTFPLWMPDVFSGAPFLAQIEAGPLFLPNWLLFGLFDPYVALNLSIALTFLAGAAGTFLLVRLYGADNISAALAGVIFALSGFNIAHIKHMSMHEAAAFLPWMVFCLEKILRSKSHLWLVLFSLLIAGQIAAGHPQISYYSLLFLFVRFLVHLARNMRARRNGATRPLTRESVLLALAVVLGIGLSALQLLTTFYFNQESTRSSGVDWDFASQFPYYLPDLLAFVYPAANGMTEWGNYVGGLQWENYGYMGVIPVIMILFSSLLLKKHASVRFHLIAILVSMLLVVGTATPFYRIVWESVPGMKLFRFPTRFLLVVGLSGAVLSALVTTRLGMRLLKSRRPYLARPVLILIFVAVLSDLYYWQRVKMPMDELNMWRKPSSIAAAVESGGRGGRIFCLLGPPVWKSAAEKSRGFVEGFEYYRRAGELPFGNLSVLHGVSSADGYTNMLNQRTAAFWQWYNLPLLANRLAPRPYASETKRITAPMASLLNVANVAYVVSMMPVNNENYRLVSRGAIKVYENTTVLPRAYIAYNWMNVENIRAAASWTYKPGDDTVPAIEGIEPTRLDSELRITAVRVQMKSPSRFECHVRPQADSYLVLSESFDSGWRAKVDGAPAVIYVANGYQQAVQVGTDSRVVVFDYRPRGFYPGAIVSIVSLASIVVWLVWIVSPSLLGRRRLRSGGEPYGT